MSAKDVRLVLEAASRVDPAAELALRIGAVASARRAEIAALRWDDFDGERLTIDSSIEVRRNREHGERPKLIDAPTKTANRRSMMLDPTLERLEAAFDPPIANPARAGEA